MSYDIINFEEIIGWFYLIIYHHHQVYSLKTGMTQPADSHISKSPIYFIIWENTPIQVFPCFLWFVPLKYFLAIYRVLKRVLSASSFHNQILPVFFFLLFYQKRSCLLYYSAVNYKKFRLFLHFKTKKAFFK